MWQTVVNIFHATKAVVGSSHGDSPKYMGEGVALVVCRASLAGQAGQIACNFM